MLKLFKPASVHKAQGCAGGAWDVRTQGGGFKELPSLAYFSEPFCLQRHSLRTLATVACVVFSERGTGVAVVGAAALAGGYLR